MNAHEGKRVATHAAQFPSEGVKKAKVDISSRRKMDFDFFVLQCKQLREWTRERATK